MISLAETITLLEKELQAARSRIGPMALKSDPMAFHRQLRAEMQQVSKIMQDRACAVIDDRRDPVRVSIHGIRVSAMTGLHDAFTRWLTRAREVQAKRTGEAA